MLAINDVIRVRDLHPPDENWNGTLAIVISNPYVHPIMYHHVVKIKIDDTLWAVEVRNVEKVSPAEKEAYFRNLESNRLVSWNQCQWKPKEKI